MSENSGAVETAPRPTRMATAVSSDGSISQFIKHHFRHFNAATLVDAADAYTAHLAQ